MLVQVIGYSSTRDLPLVHPNIETVAPRHGAQDGHGGLGERAYLRHLVVGREVVRCHVSKRAHHNVARVVGVEIHDDVGRNASIHNEPIFVRTLGRITERAA